MKTKSILFFTGIFFTLVGFSQGTYSADTTFYSNKDHDSASSDSKRIRLIEFKTNGLLAKKISFFKDGKTKYSEVNYTNGILNGKRTTFHKNGEISSTLTYINGKEEGEYVCFYRSGSKRSISKYKAGQRDGKSTEFYENGDTSSISEYGDNKYKKEISYYGNKKTSLVTYKYGKRNGPTILYYENGNTKYTCNYQDGKMYGLRICYDPKGNVSEGNFVFYNKDGSKEREGICINGKPEGVLKLYSGKNMTMLVNFKDGKPHGKTYYYDKDQNITSTEDYYDGVFIEVVKPVEVKQ